MGLGDLTPEGSEEQSSSGKSTYISFKNPRNADVSEGTEHRHKEEYYDAIQSLRNKLGQDINVVFGEFAVAADNADDGDTERLEDLFERLAE